MLLIDDVVDVGCNDGGKVVVDGDLETLNKELNELTPNTDDLGVALAELLVGWLIVSLKTTLDCCCL